MEEFGEDALFDEIGDILWSNNDTIIQIRLKEEGVTEAGFVVSIQKEGKIAYFQAEDVFPVELAERFVKWAENGGEVMPGGIYRIPLKSF